MFGTFLLGTWLIGAIWLFYELKTAPTVGEDDEFDYISVITLLIKKLVSEIRYLKVSNKNKKYN